MKFHLIHIEDQLNDIDMIYYDQNMKIHTGMDDTNSSSFLYFRKTLFMIDTSDNVYTRYNSEVTESDGFGLLE